MLGSLVSNLIVGDVVWVDTSNPLSYRTVAEYIVVPARSLRKLSADKALENAAYQVPALLHTKILSC